MKLRPSKSRDTVVLYLNGVRHEITADHAGMMLSDYLRYERGLTGTKVVCSEGDCGACSVLQYVPRTKQPIYRAINSCIVTVAQLDGTSLVTVDALAREGTLTPAQSAMVASHGSQCGFCTPGFVIAITGLVEKKICSGQALKKCTAQEAKNALTGNLCRCTGYQPIIDATTQIDLSACESVAKRFYSRAQALDLKKVRGLPLKIETPGYLFHAPLKSVEAANLLFKYPAARAVGAATDLGVAVNKGKTEMNQVVSLHLIDDLYSVAIKKGRITVGARVTLTDLRTTVEGAVPEFGRFLDLFASPQIKNSATLIGNIANASPIGDTPPFLLVANAVLHVVGRGARRKIPLEKFYLGYRKTALKRGELITAVEFDAVPKDESLALFKTSQRKDLDISAVNAAFRVEWTNRDKNKIKTARIAMGGVAATPIRLFNAEKILRGSSVTEVKLGEALRAVQSAIEPMGDLRGTPAFRRVLVDNLFMKFFREHR